MIDSILAWAGILIMLAIAVAYFWPSSEDVKDTDDSVV